MPLSPNTRLGRYEIRSQLGACGMGEVYLAYDSSLRGQVAIKLLPAEFTQNKVALSRFEREAYALRHFRRCCLFGEQQRQQQYPCIRGILRLYHHVL
jgi:serine/threonine protein kinase